MWGGCAIGFWLLLDLQLLRKKQRFLLIFSIFCQTWELLLLASDISLEALIEAIIHQVHQSSKKLTNYFYRLTRATVFQIKIGSLN